MTGLIIAIVLGWAGGYRFYKKQTGLGILYLFTGGICGIGWIIDIISALRESKVSQSSAPAAKELRVYRIKQSASFDGFEQVRVSTNYDPIQEGIKAIRLPDPSDPKHPYKIDISGEDIVFKEMSYRAVDGLECFQFYAKGYHIGTLFDDPEEMINRKYIQAMIRGKVDAVHVEIKHQKVMTSAEEYDYSYKTKLWMHIAED